MPAGDEDQGFLVSNGPPAAPLSSLESPARISLRQGSQVFVSIFSILCLLPCCTFQACTFPFFLQLIPQIPSASCWHDKEGARWGGQDFAAVPFGSEEVVVPPPALHPPGSGPVFFLSMSAASGLWLGTT